MTPTRIARMKRQSLTDLLLIAGFATVVGAEVASLASVTPALGARPRGLVIDARGEAPAGLAVDCAPESRARHIASGEIAAPVDC
jgi:hypothetical protein